MKKNFDQEVADLKNGLVSIQNALSTPTTSRRKYESAVLNEQIQIARIEFFKKGYDFCKREIKAQEKLNV